MRATGLSLRPAPGLDPLRAERFHEERSDIAKDIADLARRVAPRGRPASGLAVDVSDIRRGRILTTTHNGRRIVVQRRRAFAVFVGEGTVKKQ